MTRLNPTNGLPPAQGLYDPAHEHDACGIGFVASISGQKSHDIIKKGIQVLLNLAHRGACGCDPETGDGAGVLIQIPHRFFARESSKRKVYRCWAGVIRPSMPLRLAVWRALPSRTSSRFLWVALRTWMRTPSSASYTWCASALRMRS